MNALEVAIRSKILAVASIASLAPGGVHCPSRPQGSAFPVVVFRPVQPSEDQPSYSEDRAETHIYDVVVLGLETDSTVPAVYEAVHAALQRQNLAVSGFNSHCMRKGRIPEFPQILDGETCRRAGGTYRIRTDLI